MAGGGYGKGSGVSLADRVRAGSPPDDCPARHVWVAGSVDDSGLRRPGLLTEWRSGPGGWEGLVTYAAHVRADRWVTVQGWIPARLLAPSTDPVAQTSG